MGYKIKSNKQKVKDTNNSMRVPEGLGKEGGERMKRVKVQIYSDRRLDFEW